ncbi:hypothetical protein HDU76_009791 [Blyttiomyces sp. JEL0837]|nr:hypothetical protein HDU76_009791 [Blyttiomyces sp. JEL0837]
MMAPAMGLTPQMVMYNTICVKINSGSGQPVLGAAPTSNLNLPTNLFANTPIIHMGIQQVPSTLATSRTISQPIPPTAVSANITPSRSSSLDAQSLTHVYLRD